MKKVLVTLLVLAVAMSSVFAAVDITGELVAGYAMKVGGPEKYLGYVYGQDGENTNTAKLNFGVADENGLWSIALKGFVYADDRLGGSVTVDLAKLIAGDTNLSAKLGLTYGRITTLRAYSMQKDFDRMRTADTSLWTSLNLGYAFDGGSVEVQIAGIPALDPGKVDEEKNDGLLGGSEGDFAVSALAKWNGLAVSAGYIMKGDVSDSSMGGTGDYGKGLVGGAVDVNLGSLIGTDFDFGVAASDKYSIGDEINMLGVAAYFGFDPAKVTVQYGLTTQTGKAADHFFYAGVDVTAIENLALTVYGGAYSFSAESWYVGATAGYTVSSVTFQLGLEYANSKSFKYDGHDGDVGGFWIVPSVKVAF